MFLKCSPEMRTHIEALGLNSITSYQEWCVLNNFASTLTKNAKERRKEKRFYEHNRYTWNYRYRNKEVVLEDNITDEEQWASRGYYASLDAAIIYLYKKEMNKRNIKVTLPKPQTTDSGCKKFGYRNTSVIDAVNEAFAESRAPEELMRLLLCVSDKSDLLDTDVYVRRIAKLVDYHEEWLRSPYETNGTNCWVPPNTRSRTKKRRAFLSLVRHLFSKYSVPGFIEAAAWLRDRENETVQRWYIDIGSGKNIRKSKALPVRLTKKEAHFFLKAPDDYSTDEAFCFAQVHVLGGSSRLVDALRETRMIGHYHPFWINVIRYLIIHIKAGGIQYQDVNSIVDYLYYQKFETRTVPGELRGTVIEVGPRQPNLCMRARSPRKLLKSVEHWHREIWRNNEASRIGSWPASNIKGCVIRERNERGKVIRSWHIDELLSGDHLVAEGEAMQHCVSIYAKECLRGKTAMFSMELEQDETRDKVLTIEVSLKQPKTIRQVRGKHNRQAKDEEVEVLKIWAEKYKLRVPSYL